MKVTESGPAEMDQKLWSLYIIQCSDGSLYTGISTDVDRRVGEHRIGSRKAARYTKRSTSIDLVYHVIVGSRSLASKIEYRVKKLSRHDKETLVARSLARAELEAFVGLIPDR